MNADDLPLKMTSLTLDGIFAIQSYTSLSQMLSEVKRIPEMDARYWKLIQEFDTSCNNLFARFGSIQADKVDVGGRFCASPVRKEPSQLDFHLLDPMPESISSSDIRDLPLLSLSFSQQFYAGDLGHRDGADALLTAHLWQTRPYTDTNLVYFECAALSTGVAAVTYVPFGGTQRSISVCRYGSRLRECWASHPISVHEPVESMAIGANCLYVLTNDRIFRAGIERDGKTESAAIPPTASGRFITGFMDGVVASFHSSPQLLYVD
jgi:hypothetical protein